LAAILKVLHGLVWARVVLITVRFRNYLSTFQIVSPYDAVIWHFVVVLKQRNKENWLDIPTHSMGAAPPSIGVAATNFRRPATSFLGRENSF
jgi:hypothetical protein